MIFTREKKLLGFFIYTSDLENDKFFLQVVIEVGIIKKKRMFPQRVIIHG